MREFCPLEGTYQLYVICRAEVEADREKEDKVGWDVTPGAQNPCSFKCIQTLNDAFTKFQMKQCVHVGIFRN